MKRLTLFFTISIMLCQPLLAAEVKRSASEPNGTRDCSTCHSQEVKDLARNGAKHNNGSGCTFCHKGHPPEERTAIPNCSQCHSGTSPHYNQPDCTGCHVSAHAPKQIRFLGECVKCHEEQTAQIKQNASKHTTVACTACHVYKPEKPHGYIPDCLSCHKPHASGLTTANCLKCHQAHTPKYVTYGFNTPSKGCAACHQKAYDLLTASRFKHRTLVCAACHQAKHKMVPQCRTCHGAPHEAKLHTQFPKCSTCHNTAHDLTITTPDKFL